MRTDVEDLDLPAVEREVTALAGHLAAATCRYLQLLSVFDSGGGWRGYGLRSCTQWLSWKCGLSTGTAREQLRVAHALDELPLVREAFAEGRISYSKARALTRAATPATETNLLGTAIACTASQLDRLCSGIGRALSSEEVLDQAARASFTARWETDGSLRFSGRLSAEDGEVLLAALAVGRPDPVLAPAPGPDDSPTGDDTSVAAGTGHASGDGRADGPGRDAADGSGGGRGVDRPDAAREAAHSDAAALVLIAQHALSVPPPQVGTAPVRLVVHTTTDALDVAAPSAVTRPAESEDASAEAPMQAAPDVVAGPADPGSASAEAVAVAVLDAGPGIPLLPLGPDTLRRLACEALVEPATHPDADDHLAANQPAADRAGSDQPGAGRPARVQHRFATVRQRRALLARDGGCCFPGCPRRHGLHAHHLLPWHQGGPTAMDNLALICSHHHRLVHEGGWQLHQGSDRRWQAVRPDGKLITAAPSAHGNVRQLPLAHDADIAPDTVTGHWLGEPLELDYAVSVYAASST